MGDLVDEYQVYVHPVLVGEGKPALSGLRRDLTLTETKKFGNGVVLLRYSSDR